MIILLQTRVITLTGWDTPSGASGAIKKIEGLPKIFLWGEANFLLKIIFSSNSGRKTAVAIFEKWHKTAALFVRVYGRGGYGGGDGVCV